MKLQILSSQYGIIQAMQMTHDERVKRWLARTTVNDNGCWIWPGAKFRKGYGNVSIVTPDGMRRNAGLHRVVYEYLVGPIPEGLQLDHLCRVSACCNPAHLEPVTHQENLRRAVGMGGLRSRGNAADNAAKTHCIHGHPFDEANTHYTKAGARQCRACGRDWYHRNRSPFRVAA